MTVTIANKSRYLSADGGRAEIADAAEKRLNASSGNKKPFTNHLSVISIWRLMGQWSLPMT